MGGSSNSKSGSWAQALFAGNVPNPNMIPTNASHTVSANHENHDSHLPESPISSYNQQATNAVLSLLNIHVCCAVILCMCI